VDRLQESGNKVYNGIRIRIRFEAKAKLWLRGRT
jgi:hypothetical protein